MTQWSGRPLRLKYPPDVENAPVHAANIVATARDVDGVDLDYTPGSLDAVDRILDAFSEQGTGSDELAETLWAFGCYVGEVFVRHAGRRWIVTPAAHRSLLGFPIVLESDSGRLTNPIGKVFKRLDNGSVDSLPYFYRVSAAD